MKLDPVREIIREFDKDLDLEDGGDDEFYLFVSSRKHRYYVGCLKLSELRNSRDLRRYLDCISVKES